MKKRGVFTDNIVPWIIVVLVIILSIIVYGIFSGKLGIYLQYFKDLLKIGK